MAFLPEDKPCDASKSAGGSPRFAFPPLLLGATMCPPSYEPICSFVAMFDGECVVCILTIARRGKLVNDFTNRRIEGRLLGFSASQMLSFEMKAAVAQDGSAATLFLFSRNR
jgi:hypothetical protein